jgi:hypothetical protein
LILGAFLPLMLVVGLSVFVACVLLKHEIRKIKGIWETTGSNKLSTPPSKEPWGKSFNKDLDPRGQAMRKDLLLVNLEDISKLKAMEQEEDESWLAEITSKLDPASADDMDLLYTAKEMLKRENDAKWNSAAQSTNMKHAHGSQEKELYKRFIERELVKLNSAK